MSDHEAGTADGVSRVAAAAQAGVRPPGLVPAAEADGAVCGSVCVSARTRTCATGHRGTAPDQEMSGRQGTGAAAVGAVWVPAECTLPVVQQPSRVAEFAALLSAAVRAVARPEPTRLGLVLEPAFEAAARDLAVRESGCCSFFTFTFARGADGLHLEISVSSAQVVVLDALAEQAGAALAQVRW